MKRTDFFIRLTTAVLFFAVICYIGFYIYNSVINTYETTPAMTFTIEETLPAHGYIVRTESVLSQTGDTLLPVVGEGEKVASGQAVLVEYSSRAALETASEIRSLKLRIAKLENSGMVAESTRLNSVLALSKAVNRNDLNMLDELSINIESYFFIGSGAQENDLPALKTRLETLERRSEGVRTIYAPASGIFSQVVDGFEHVGPNTLNGIAPAGLSDLFKAASGARSSGKLVTEFTWYYAAVMSAQDAAQLNEGRPATVRFSGIYNTSAQMTVESIGRRDDDGFCLVVFSSGRSISDVAGLRELRSEIVYRVISGIRVPKEAIHLEDDKTFVYLQTGVRAERVGVEILREYGGSYLVRDGLETGSPLRAGSTIIVKANGLFDGKIVA